MNVLNQGQLSKSQGLVLRVATVLHLLFHLEGGGTSVPQVVSDQAVSAAIDFIKLTCQQTAYIVGRGSIEGEVQKFHILSIHLVAFSCLHFKHDVR